MIFGKKDRERVRLLEEKLTTIQNSLDVPIASRGYELYEDLIAAIPAGSGKPVNFQTSMKSSIVFACVRLICESIASMPVCVYQRDEDDIHSPAPKDVANGLWWLLNESPCDMITAASWHEWMLRDAMLKGDGISIIGRKGPAVDALIPIPRENCVIERRQDRLRYYVNTVENGYQGFDQDDVIHLPGFGYGWDTYGLGGMSVIKWAAFQAIGIQLGADDFAARFFTNGAIPKIALEVPGALANKGFIALQEEWKRHYAGYDNAHSPIILTHGAKANALSLNAEDAQLLATRLFQVGDIARAFGVPGHLVNDSDKNTSWGTGIEAIGQGFVKYTLRGWLNRLQQELNRKIWPRQQKYFLEYDISGLTAGDLKTEADYNRAALGGPNGPGWASPNEIRKKKHQPPMDGGDKLYGPTDPTSQEKTDGNAKEAGKGPPPGGDEGKGGKPSRPPPGNPGREGGGRPGY